MWFVSIHPLVKVCLVGEEVSNGIFIPWDVFDSVVKVLKVFDPFCLLARYFLGLAKVLEVFIICVYFN